MHDLPGTYCLNGLLLSLLDEAILTETLKAVLPSFGFNPAHSLSLENLRSKLCNFLVTDSFSASDHTLLPDLDSHSLAPLISETESMMPELNGLFFISNFFHQNNDAFVQIFTKKY